MAGKGGADHPRSRREDALFRGRAARICRGPFGILAIHVGARSHGEEEERLPHAKLQHQLGLRVRGHNPVLLDDRARLRRYLRAHDHEQTGSLAASRVASTAGRRRLQHSGYGYFSARQRSVRGHAGLSRLALQRGHGGTVQHLRQMGVGLERDAAVGQELPLRLRPDPKPANSDQFAQRQRGLRVIASLPRGSRRPQLL